MIRLTIWLRDTQRSINSTALLQFHDESSEGIAVLLLGLARMSREDAAHWARRFVKRSTASPLRFRGDDAGRTCSQQDCVSADRAGNGLLVVSSFDYTAYEPRRIVDDFGQDLPVGPKELEVIETYLSQLLEATTSIGSTPVTCKDDPCK